MIPAHVSRPGSPVQNLELQSFASDLFKNPETFYADFKRYVLKSEGPHVPLETLISNGVAYLLQWGIANGTVAGIKPFVPTDGQTSPHEVAHSVASAFSLMSIAIDILSVQNCAAAQSQLTAIQENLKELFTAIHSGQLTSFELANMLAQCAINLQAAERLPGKAELFTKVFTDGVAGIVSFVQQGYNYDVLMKKGSSDDIKDSIQSASSDKNIPNSDLKENIPNADAKDGLSHLEAKGTINSDGVTESVEKKLSTFDAGMNAAGAVTSLFGMGRGAYELVRSLEDRREMVEKTNVIDDGIQALNGETGTHILQLKKKSVEHRRSANRWAIFGAITRIFGSGFSFAVKVASLIVGAAVAPIIVPIISAVVILLYAVKNAFIRVKTRYANRLDNRLMNTVKILSKASSAAYRKYLQPALVNEFVSLSRGGRQLWNFLKSMGRSNMFADVRAQLSKLVTAEDRLPLIHQLVEICTTPLALLREKLSKSKSAMDARILNFLTPANNEEVVEPSFEDEDQRELEDDFQLESTDTSLKFTAEEVAMFDKFVEGKMDKAIAASSGVLPGWRMSSGNADVVKKMSIHCIKAQVGDTPETDLTLKVLDGLNRNGKTRNSSLSAFFKGFIMSRTWNLTRHGDNCQKVLERQKPAELEASTLAAAYTTHNADVIAQCRFIGNPAEQDLLKAQLNNSTPSALKAILKAIEGCNGKELIKQWRRAGDGFEANFKAAFMLMNRTGEEANRIFSMLTPYLTATADIADLSAALNILSGQKLQGKFNNTTLFDDVCKHLVAENTAYSTFNTRPAGPSQSVPAGQDNAILLTPTSATDARQKNYIDDIVKGNISIKDLPPGLLSDSVRNALQARWKSRTIWTAFMRKLSSWTGWAKPAVDKALSEQLYLHFIHKDPKQSPLVLTWPDSAYYGNTAKERSENLRNSFKSLLGINADNYTLSELLTAASVYTNWDDGASLTKIKAIIGKGGLQAAVALHHITGLQGMKIPDDAALDRINAAVDLAAIQEIFRLPLQHIVINPHSNPNQNKGLGINHEGGDILILKQNIFNPEDINLNLDNVNSSSNEEPSNSESEISHNDLSDISIMQPSSNRVSLHAKFNGNGNESSLQAAFKQGILSSPLPA
ncbi:MAG: hypothetical protein KIT86_17375 [Hydrogenophaga sp.]|uniref:hypothetical protein n=1 Tax=Hydrogenophaga sp. TaxID=1904254 RepID=UPI0026105CEA|nr:hypothetical protein [Hydrogenophaga sp.]MCW5671429.1 hypothetical protein [Hydrogenophaga sp.]